ncbi:MAG: FAD-dependent oxidoreductase [Spirochaetaceae bacterium]|jgi:hypothetical protein|nr:FAD-dependent oxidoreductase [Spirochaetaceae bacterium]
MRTIREPAKNIPVLAEADILVIGGGPAGIAAAIAAAREGAETILVERYGCFGGTLTQTGVEAIAWYRHQGTVEAGGLLKEIEAAAQAMGASTQECQSDSQAIDPHLFRYVCDKMIEDAGVKPILHCMAVDAIIDQGKFAGVLTESKSGRQAIIAKRGIDCTGDADIAARSGVPFYKAPKEELMFVTQIFGCRRVDTKKFIKYVEEELKPTYRDWSGDCWNQKIDENAAGMFSPYIEKVFIEALREGSLQTQDKEVSFGGTWSTVTPEGEVTQLNMVSIRNIDCTDVFDLTRAEIIGRRNCIKALETLKKSIPGFENASLSNFGMTIGTRESRLIKGLYTITAGDVFNQGRFEDSIAIFPEFIDGREFLVLPLSGRYYQIPYRALVPQGVDNLLVAGRCISGEPAAHTSFRNMACCVATGQAAGIAAACSLGQGVSVKAAPIPLVQEALTAQGVRYQ